MRRRRNRNLSLNSNRNFPHHGIREAEREFYLDPKVGIKEYSFIIMFVKLFLGRFKLLYTVLKTQKYLTFKKVFLFCEITNLSFYFKRELLETSIYTNKSEYDSLISKFFLRQIRNNSIKTLEK